MTKSNPYTVTDGRREPYCEVWFETETVRVAFELAGPLVSVAPPGWEDCVGKTLEDARLAVEAYRGNLEQRAARIKEAWEGRRKEEGGKDPAAELAELMAALGMLDS